ncbi:MAG: hypothetical protein E7164_02985 [Firmicutes bacterium]|nr:hypothetical protein [Bacillota bacterium]
MNKKYVNFILLSGVLMIIIFAFEKSQIIALSVTNSFNIFITRIFPFLFIMMVCNNLLTSLNFPYYLSKLFPHPYIYLFIMSLLSGSPINAVLINSFINQKILTPKEGSIALTFSTLNNPLFLLSYFKLIFLNQITIIKLFLIIYLSNFTILIWAISKNPKLKYQAPINPINIQKSLIFAITSSIKNLINILAIITFFKLISDLFIPRDSSYTILIKGLIELTQGLNALPQLLLTTTIKELLVIVILLFAGFSIHIQISNILANHPINYKYFYLSRLILCIFGVIIVLST